MQERIKQVRKELGLNQSEFGKRIGVMRSTVASYENGIRVPLQTVIMSICKEFNISEEWLLTGKGDMHRPLTREQEINQIANRFFEEDDPFKIELVRIIAELTPEQIQLLKDLAIRLAKEAD